MIKNVKQFLENNRILAREIAVETGLSQDDINAYMEGNSNFDDEKRKEFYKWYLTKILRPPNGRGKYNFRYLPLHKESLPGESICLRLQRRHRHRFGHGDAFFVFF